ncbi:MAG TPA: alpha/beta hydrolase [Ruania sp.]|nr:alpha/beta hydrolase [Ruania sp.]
MSTQVRQRRWPRRLRRVGLTVLAVAAAVTLVVVVAFYVSYWPATWLLRGLPAFGDEDPAAGHVPEVQGVHSNLDLTYRPEDPDGRLDVFWPQGTTEQQPTVVWIHGGAFVAGDKIGPRTYLQTLAKRGYTTVAVEYSEAPEKQYPYQLNQIADALDYLQDNAERLHIDPGQIILGGDSAGAHMAAQTAMAITDDAYARAAGLPQPLQADQLSATILASGAYDLYVPDYGDGIAGKIEHDIIWAYTGERNFLADPHLEYASLPQHVSGSFPPTFITAGNADPLETHSKSMASGLQEAGVQTQAVFYPSDYHPALGHEYQFDLATPAAEEALDGVLDFLAQHTTAP